MSFEAPTITYTPDEDEPLSVAIVDALSEAKERDITQDECVLYNSIDPDSLDQLFREQSEQDTIKIEFTTHDAIVVLWGDGRVHVEVQDLERDPQFD